MDENNQTPEELSTSTAPSGDFNNVGQPSEALIDPTPGSNPASARPQRRFLRSLARYAAIWLIAFLVIRFIIPSYDVQGSSMLPTLPVSGERVLTDQLFFKLTGGPSRSDIVVVSTEGLHLSEPYLIKRVVGLPGEKLEIRKGVVYINDQALGETYIQNKATYNYAPTVLSKDCYFVMGDNRPVSLDSHYFGCVPKSNITAKVLFKYPWHF